MQETARKIHADQSLIEVEDRIASVKEIFRLQGADELAAAERRYFGAARREARAIVLAASRGAELEHLTGDRPKAMLPVNGKPLLGRLVELCKRQGIDGVTVVAGYKASSIDVAGIDLVLNDRYAASDELASLACARDAFRDDMVILYGDLIFRGYVLRGLMDSERELTVVVDSQDGARAASGVPDYAFCTAPDDRALWDQDVLLSNVMPARCVDGAQADGRWIGMLRARADGRAWIEEALDALGARPDFDRLTLRDLLNHVVRAGHPVHVIYIHGHWLDVNSLTDLEQAGAFAAGQR